MKKGKKGSRRKLAGGTSSPNVRQFFIAVFPCQHLLKSLDDGSLYITHLAENVIPKYTLVTEDMPKGGLTTDFVHQRLMNVLLNGYLESYIFQVTSEAPSGGLLLHRVPLQQLGFSYGEIGPRKEVIFDTIQARRLATVPSVLSILRQASREKSNRIIAFVRNHDESNTPEVIKKSMSEGFFVDFPGHQNLAVAARVFMEEYFLDWTGRADPNKGEQVLVIYLEDGVGEQCAISIPFKRANEQLSYSAVEGSSFSGNRGGVNREFLCCNELIAHRFLGEAEQTPEIVAAAVLGQLDVDGKPRDLFTLYIKRISSNNGVADVGDHFRNSQLEDVTQGQYVLSLKEGQNGWMLESVRINEEWYTFTGVAASDPFYTTSGTGLGRGNRGGAQVEQAEDTSVPAHD